MRYFATAVMGMLISFSVMAWEEAKIVVNMVEGAEWPAIHYDVDGNILPPRKLFDVSLDQDPGFDAQIEILYDRGYGRHNPKTSHRVILGAWNTPIPGMTDNRPSPRHGNVKVVITATKFPTDEIFHQVKFSIPVAQFKPFPIASSGGKESTLLTNKLNLFVPNLGGTATVNVRLREEPTRNVPIEIRPYISRSTFFGSFSQGTAVLTKDNWKDGVDLVYQAPHTIPNDYDRQGQVARICGWEELYELNIGEGAYSTNFGYGIFIQVSDECEKAEQAKRIQEHDNAIIYMAEVSLDPPKVTASRAQSKALKQVAYTLANIKVNPSLWDADNVPTLRFYCEGESGTTCSTIIMTYGTGRDKYRYGCVTSETPINIRSGEYVDMPASKLNPRFAQMTDGVLECGVFSDNDFSLQLFIPPN